MSEYSTELINFRAIIGILLNSKLLDKLVIKFMLNFLARTKLMYTPTMKFIRIPRSLLNIHHENYLDSNEIQCLVDFLRACINNGAHSLGFVHGIKQKRLWQVQAD